MQGKTILIVDDDPILLRFVELIFSQAGCKVYTATDGAEGLRQFYTHQPDLVVLDVMMPDINGWQVCQQIRQSSEVPIMMLTALGRDEDIVQGLEGGADDYVTKPFNPKVLTARAQATLRRAAMSPVTEKKSSIYNDGYLTIDLDRQRVLVRHQPVRLTSTEYRLLVYLVQNAGRVLSCRQILEHIWGWEYQDSVEYVHVYISRLRRKLEEDSSNPRYLLTEHGIGYSFPKYPPQSI